MNTTTQSAGTDVLNIVFQNEITDEGISALLQKYPTNLVVDMSDDKQFKDGRKTRAERNKLTKAINARRIEICQQIKARGDQLIEQVEGIYSVVVAPFEIEETRRKEAKAKAELEHQKLLDGQRAEIQALRAFITDCEGKSSQYIADVMESVDLLETSCFDKELIHEAIEAKKDVLNRLFQMQTQAKANEQLEAEKAELHAKQEAAAKAQAITDKIAEIRMEPANCITKSSAEIDARIGQLRTAPMHVEEFGDRLSEAQEAIEASIAQLGQMYHQKKQLEALAPAPEPEVASEPETCKLAPLTYTPLGIWPSAKARRENGDLDLVCAQLEKAEAFIAQMADEQSAA
ncbi:hypothetical protein [Pseudoalteromonas sp. R3]|uniref:hypothetical protein n=1 Tax=Pseudoalteromonas sp. R3 TaxID=1709477 RepID=UPI0006B54DB2|nr:hypothetical protein [Pseudoalteromonas sp. R3]AZZ98788.1 hypothetical protein ELR70_17780 [Pseudoalteromonas sp. R3]